MWNRILIIGIISLLIGQGFSESIMAQSQRYGPEVKSFLSYLRQEETELQFQITHKEIDQKEYTLSMARIAIHRQAILDYYKKTGEDRIPEYHIVTASEADQLIPGGAEVLQGMKTGALITAKWKFINVVTKGEPFYILERIDLNE